MADFRLRNDLLTLIKNSFSPLESVISRLDYMDRSNILSKNQDAVFTSNFYNHTVVKFDSLIGQCEVYRNTDFDFAKCKTISINLNLYAFGWGKSMSVTRYFNFKHGAPISSEHLAPANLR